MDKKALLDGLSLVNKKLFKTLVQMKQDKMKKIDGIFKAVQDNKILLYYPTEKSKAAKFTYLLDGDKVHVDLTALTTNLDKALEKGTIEKLKLYMYLLEAYAVLKWDTKLYNSIELNRFALFSYNRFIKRILMSINPDMLEKDMKKYAFLFTLRVANLSKLNIRDKHSFVANLVGLPEDVTFESDSEKVLLESNNVDTIWKDMVANIPTINKESSKVFYLIADKLLGTTGTLYLDNIAYYPAFALDLMINNQPFIFDKYKFSAKAITTRGVYVDILSNLD